jgi:hypothetical protein
MPYYCKECKESVAWATKTCPFCGTDNPTGMHTEWLWIIGALFIIIFIIIPALFIGFGKGLLPAILHQTLY